MEVRRGRGGVRGRAAVGRGGRGGRGGVGRGKPVFKKSAPTDPRVNSDVQIFVEGLPLSTKIPEVVQYFSTVGDIKIDRDSKKPRVWLYTDKITGQPTGEATITYSNPDTQKVALYTYHHQQYQGNMIRVTPSIVKPHMATIPLLNRGRGRGASRGRGRGRGVGPGREGGGGKMRTRDNSDRNRGGKNSSFGRNERSSGYGSDGSYGGMRGGGGYGNHGKDGYGGEGRGMMRNYSSYGRVMSSDWFPGSRSDVSSGTFRSGAINNPPPLFGSSNSWEQFGQYQGSSGGGRGFMSTRYQRYQPY